MARNGHPDALQHRQRRAVEVPYEEAGSDATGNRNFPIALTDDGRILVTDGYIDRSGVPASRYALIDLGAYLAGSREYTAVEMWTE